MSSIVIRRFPDSPSRKEKKTDQKTDRENVRQGERFANRRKHANDKRTDRDTGRNDLYPLPALSLGWFHIRDSANPPPRFQGVG